MLRFEFWEKYYYIKTPLLKQCTSTLCSEGIFILGYVVDLRQGQNGYFVLFVAVKPVTGLEKIPF